MTNAAGAFLVQLPMNIQTVNHRHAKVLVVIHKSCLSGSRLLRMGRSMPQDGIQIDQVRLQPTNLLKLLACRRSGSTSGK